MNSLLTLVQNNSKESFDGILMNYYRNGADTIGWHSDREIEPDTTIATVSLGVERKFLVKHMKNQKSQQIELSLKHGSLLLMKGTMQKFYLHTVPKDQNLCVIHRSNSYHSCDCFETKRISLTFRHYHKRFKEGSVEKDSFKSETTSSTSSQNK